MNKKYFITGLSILLAYSGVTHAQNAFDFKDVTKVSGNFNKDIEISKPLVSPDGSKLYFIRTTVDEKGNQFQNTYFLTRQGDAWSSEAVLLQIEGGNETNRIISISNDGLRLYTLDMGGSTNSGKRILNQCVKNGDSWKVDKKIEMPSINADGRYFDIYLSTDENYMLITSFDVRGFGNEDLYVSSKKPNGTWSEVINLGSTINTSGFESAPYLSKDNKTIFFSSNGHGGLGEDDIFMATRLDNSWVNWSKPTGLGEKINSPKFDSYFTIGKNAEVYFVSNRDGNPVSLLYSTLLSSATEALSEKVKEEQQKSNEQALQDIINKMDDVESVEIKVKKKQPVDMEALNKTLDEIMARLDKLEKAVYSQPQAINTGNPETGKKSDGAIKPNDNKPTTTIVKDPELGNKVDKLTKRIEDLESKIRNGAGNSGVPNDGMGESFLEGMTYFGFDSDNLRPESAKIMDEVVEYLNANPSKNVELNGYSSRPGREEYNMKLSQRRADNCKDYLISKGINASRISSVGKGETDFRKVVFSFK